jgi:hypothetical protein
LAQAGSVVNMHWLGEPKDQKSAFFEPNSWTLGIAGWPSVAAHEKAGRLDGHTRSCELDGLQSKANKTAIALDIGSPG